MKKVLPLCSALFLICLCAFNIPLTHASLTQPEEVSRFIFPSEFLNNETLVDILVDSEYIYIIVTGDENRTLVCMNYSADGSVDLLRKYDISQPMLFRSSLVVPRPGYAVLGISYQSDDFYDTTTITIFDVVANITINSTVDNSDLIDLLPIVANSKYPLYGTSFYDNQTIYLFSYDEFGGVSLDFETITLTDVDAFFVGQYLYTIEDSGTLLCSYPLPYEPNPISCINLVETTGINCTHELNPNDENSTATYCVYDFRFSSDGRRLLLDQLNSYVEGYTLIVFDVTDNGLALRDVFHTGFVDTDWYGDAFITSSRGDFVLQAGTYLNDISSGQISPMYSFENIFDFHASLMALSPDDKFLFYLIAGREDTDTLLMFTYDINAALSPTLLGINNEVPNSWSNDNNLVMDESTGRGYFTSDKFPYVFAMNIDELETSVSPIINIDTKTGVGTLFKDHDSEWFSKIETPKPADNYWQWDSTVRFCLLFFNSTNHYFYNTISITANTNMSQFVPVAHKLWVSETGDMYPVVLWADEIYDSNGYSPATIAVYRIPRNTSFPVQVSEPVATFNLDSSVVPIIYISGFTIPYRNLYVALWNDNSELEDGFEFSVVVGVSGAYELNWMNISYVESTNTITVTDSITVETNCRFIQSIRVRNSTWVLCVSSDDSQYIVMRYETDLLQPSWTFITNTQFNHSQFDFFFAWWVSSDEQRLAFVNGSGTFLYNVPEERFSYSFQNGFTYTIGGIYHKTEPTESYALALASALGGALYYDCGPGSKPNLSNYCSKCSPGYFGYGCSSCPAGYICDGYGLSSPSSLCPAGYYCETGTNSSVIGDPGGPQPCLAGSYCPTGMGTSVIGPDRISPKPCAASFYCPAASTLPTAEACPLHTYSDSGASSRSDCKCEMGYFGYNGHCIECPPQCICYADVISGCWIPSTFVNSTTVRPLRCPVNSVLSNTSCNPNLTSWHGETEFPCEIGYGNRQCSKCDRGYFASGRACHKCNETLKLLLPGSYLVVVIALMIYAWNIRPANSATFKIVTVHFQSLLIFVVGGMEWDSITSKFIHSTASSFNFSLSAIECLFPTWKLMESLLFAVTLPIGIGILALIAGVVVWIWRRLRIRLERCIGMLDHHRSSVGGKMIKTMATLLDLLYFSIALMTFQMLGCTSSAGGFYLTSYPWLQCETRAWAPYLGIAVVALVFEVIAPPVILMVALRRNKDLLLSKNTKAILGSFYLVYTHDNYFWEGIVIVRRLVIAFLSTLIPYGSIILFIALFIVFHIYAVALLRRMPYATRRDNIMDVASQCILLTTLYCGFFVDFAVTDYKHLQISYFAGAVNLIFMVFGAVFVLFENVPLVLMRVFRALPRVSRATTMDEREALVINEEEQNEDAL